MINKTDVDFSFNLIKMVWGSFQLLYTLISLKIQMWLVHFLKVFFCFPSFGYCNESGSVCQIKSAKSAIFGRPNLKFSEVGTKY